MSLRMVTSMVCDCYCIPRLGIAVELRSWPRDKGITGCPPPRFAFDDLAAAGALLGNTEAPIECQTHLS